MTAASANRTIAAMSDEVNSSLTINHPEYQGTTSYFYEDYVLTAVTPGSLVRIALESTSFNGYLEILNAATGETAADSRDFLSDTTTYLSFPPIDGIGYIVRVSTSPWGGRTGDFTLRTFAPFTPPLIGSVELGGSVISGTLTTNDAQDPLSGKYSKDNELTGLTATVPVQVTLTGVDGLDTVVQIINKYTGELIGFDDENGGNGSARYTFVPSDGITYLARATSYASSTTGSFTLSSAMAPGTVDLQMLSAIAPASSRIGSNISMSWTVKNSGTTSLAAQWVDAVFLSLDQRLDGHDIQMEWRYIDTPPAAGSTYTRSYSTIVQPPDDVAPGNYYLLFLADYVSYIGESNEHNNQISLPFTLQPPDPNRPDLTITTGTAPTSGSVGSSLNLSWTVKNIGATAANADWTDAIYLSTDETYDFNDQFISSFYAADRSPLAAGGSYTLTNTISVPSISAAGQYYLIIKTDGFSNQVELSESNNTTALPISLDLIVNDGAVSFSISGTPAVGNTLTATTSSPDPEGNGTFFYSWQSSTDGTSWSLVGNNSSSYLVGSADHGKQLRLEVFYLDGQGFLESVTTSVGLVLNILSTTDSWSYIASHADLITAFGSDLEAAVSHYVTNGFNEGRALDTFDEIAYASAYPDLSSAFGNDRDALTRHYVEYGFNEGRSSAFLGIVD